MTYLRRSVFFLASIGLCAACNLYNASLVSNGGPNADGAMGDASSCFPTAELCNGKDDDCDGRVDEDGADCRSHVLNGQSSCEQGQCVWLRQCDKGYFNCDGRPENGCESHCPCGGCPDLNDAGPDAG